MAPRAGARVGREGLADLLLSFGVVDLGLPGAVALAAAVAVVAVALSDTGGHYSARPSNTATFSALAYIWAKCSDGGH
jgi:hypothetical protein